MSSSRRASVSFTTMPPGVLSSGSAHGSSEDVQIALAPYIQAYLSQTERRHSCCSVVLPVAFERAAAKSWLDPRFDSPILEGQYQASVFPQIRLRFRFALLYILLVSLVWSVYFLVEQCSYWIPIFISFAATFVLAFIGLLISYTNLYRAHSRLASITAALVISCASLCFAAFTSTSFSPLGHFAICIETILLIYTLIPMRLWQNISIAILYSSIFELINIELVEMRFPIGPQSPPVFYKVILLRALLHICVHVMGFHVLIMSVVRMRGTFMKVGQNLLMRRQLEMEKQLKQKMIHSVMPPKVADILLKEGCRSMEQEGGPNRDSQNVRPRTSNDVKSLFRPFHMHSMENVSILFADIVGFTKMSSTKTAEQLVEILNDLFERFDDLCTISGCEKISTLGDCYYCVSGCPEPRPDHAICAVEMGLGMITAMQTFDKERHEGVRMRVGVHTGTVLCGIVGTRRVKFDVWSNDVSFANKMESSGTPERVHISEETCSFLGDNYMLEEGNEVDGHRTYFVVDRKRERTSSFEVSSNDLRPSNQSLKLIISPPDGGIYNGFTNGVQLSQSATNISSVQPAVPPASPVGPISTSLNPSPILSSRPRLASFSKMSKYFSSHHTGNGHAAAPIISKPHPKIPLIVTTKSLPGSLDSENEDEGCCRGGGGGGGSNKNARDEEIVTTKYANKFKNWKVPKLFRKDSSSCIVEISAVDETKKPLNDPPPVVMLEQNGYQPLPILIEPTNSNFLTIDVPGRPSSRSPDSNCSPREPSVFDDIIDVRSYISQSRSDISPFGRSGSYRSQGGRSGQQPNSSSSPVGGRPRSSTVSAGRSGEALLHRNHSIGPWGDGLSICPSLAASRKDSGIKSNSRRSSIQQQIFAMNQSALSQQRVSGYFTSSQSSISIAPEPHMGEAHPDPLAACLQQLRKQSDLQLIRCVQDNAKSQRSYLVKPPLSGFSLFFKSRAMERDFRSKAHLLGDKNTEDDDNCDEGLPTLATPRYNTYIDIFIGILVFFAISACLFLMSPVIYNVPFRIWVSIFTLFSAIQFFALFLFTRQIFRSNNTVTNRSCEDTLFSAISSWYPWHICLGILMSLPVTLVVVNFCLQDFKLPDRQEFYYGCLVFVCIIHFCNFTQLNCWVRNSLAFVTAVGFIVLALVNLNEVTVPVTFLQDGMSINESYLENSSPSFKSNITTSLVNTTHNWFHAYQLEIYIDLLLLLTLVWFLNREFEIGYRLTFYGNAVANQDKRRVQSMKNQADMLLHNIIPKHVAEQLKNTAKYSENHRNVGIIFASIVNFNELYDESYLGGKEYLRVLNELIGDFDELLSRPEYKCIEKIKTIGSTFMAASGLDPNLRGDANEHLHALMEFSMEMQQVVDNFNKDLLEFNLILRIGFNVGDVTAGVIGTSKLHYDIWGDAVNVASRMDSTGVSGRLQVGQACLAFLEDQYDFEARGEVYVKGKDHMVVFLLTGRKPDSPDLPDMPDME